MRKSWVWCRFPVLHEMVSEEVSVLIWLGAIAQLLYT